MTEEEREDLKHDDPDWFQCFVHEFFGLDRRHSHAFWHKIAFKLDGVTVYRDGDIWCRPLL